MSKEVAESNAKILAIVSVLLRDADKRRQEGDAYGDLSLRVSYAGGRIREIKFEEATVVRADELCGP